MKKPLIYILTGTALLAAGYWAGRATHPGDAESLRRGGAASVPAGRAESAVPGAGKAAAAEEVRTFAPGRPFTKGGAKAWLLGLAPLLSGDDQGNAVAMVELAQVFLTMDEASVQEVSAALKELGALYKSGDAAMQAIPDADDMLEGALMLSMVRLSQLNPEAALAMLKETPEIKADQVMLFVFGRLAADNPQRAEQMALSLDDRQKNNALEAVMYSMANKDPAGALAFAARHPDAIADHDERRVLEGWVKRDPRAAMAGAVQAMERTGDPEMVRKTLEEWFQRDGNEASIWAAAHEGPGKVTAQALMLEQRAVSDPAGVLGEFAALQQSAGDGKELARLAGTLAESLAVKDLPAAREWAQSLPAGALQDATVRHVTEQWVKEDAPAASEWIKTLPPGDARDAAAGQLAGAISRRDPASAFEWARSIQNGDHRTDTMSNVIRVWREQDPEAARTMVESLPEDVRAKLR